MRLKVHTKATLSDAMTALEKANREVAYQAALEGIVLLENDEVTLKRVFYKDGDMILQPENDAYEPIVVPLKDVMDRRVQILGRLVHNKIRY